MRRILLGALCVCLLLLIIVAALRHSIGATLPAHPDFAVTLPQWTPAGWNNETVTKAIDIIPRKSTFMETLLAFPLLLGWWVHFHPTWGLPLLFGGTFLLLGLWKFVAHVLGHRKPALLFPTLLLLQCAALGWGWSFFLPLPYTPRTHLAIVDVKSTLPGFLDAHQKVRWFTASGFNGFSTYSLKGTYDPETAEPADFFLITDETLRAQIEQLSSQADWWLFPQDATQEKRLAQYQATGKYAAVSLNQPLRLSWQMLAPASRINVFLSAISLLLIAFLYAIQPAVASASAPSRIMNFLQKRRRTKRWGGLAMMLLACLGTLLSLWLTFYPAWGFERRETLSLGITALLWLALDFAYWQGRKSWTRKH